MTPWTEKQLALLRQSFPKMEHLPAENWCRLSSFTVPPGWSASTVELCFRITESEAIAPYGFWVRPALLLAGGTMPQNCTMGVQTGFGEGWAQFSWAPVDWRPTASGGGDNILHFVRSFSDRLRDLS